MKYKDIKKGCEYMPNFIFNKRCLAGLVESAVKNNIVYQVDRTAMRGWLRDFFLGNRIMGLLLEAGIVV
jgi:hypothetical protein